MRTASNKPRSEEGAVIWSLYFLYFSDPIRTPYQTLHSSGNFKQFETDGTYMKLALLLNYATFLSLAEERRENTPSNRRNFC